MPIVAVSKPLREKLGDDAVDSLIDLLKQSQDEQKNNILEFVEEKFERRLAEESSRLRDEIHQTRTDLGAEIQSVRIEIHQVRADLIKWMFIFWIGQVGVILGMMFAFFK